MSSSRLELVVDSRAAEQHLSRLDRELQRLDGRGSAATAMMGKMTLAIGAISAAAGGLGFSRIIRETASFEDAMLGLQSVSGATAKQMADLEKQARTLGATSMFSAEQAGNAQRYLAMAGLEVNEVLSATPGILKLATAGQLDLATAADIASNVLGGLGLEVSELARVTDVLAATSSGANTDIRQLGDALSYAAPFAAAAGLSLEETAAAIGAMSDAGIQSTRAGTGLVGILAQLAEATPKAQAAIEGAGLSMEKLDVNARGLQPVLDDLRGANLTLSEALQIFGREAGAAALNVISASEGVAAFTKELEDSEGAAERMALIIGSGLTGSMRGFNSMMSESVLRLGESGLAGGFGLVVDNATGVLAVYNDLLPEFAEANNLTETQIDRIEMLAGGFDLLKDAAILASGVIAARMVGALGAATAAKIAAAASAVRYQIAVTTLTGVSARAAAGQVALAGATRGAAGALALVGGPLGAAVIAAGAIYYFREELGLTQRQAGLTEDEIASLRQEMADLDGTAITQTLEQVENALMQVGLKAAAAREELAQLRSENRGSGVLGFEAGSVGEEIRGMQAVAEYTEKMTELGQRRTVMQEELNSRTNEGTKAMDDMVVTGDRLVGSVNEQATAAKGASKEVTSLSDAYESLLDRITPNRREARQYARDLGVLNLALASGRMNTQEYMQAMGMLQESFQAAQRETTEIAVVTDVAADEMARAWEEATNRIDQTFSDAFAGAFDSFSSFSDQLLDGFKRLLAELAYQATLKPIVVGFTQDMRGMMSGGGGGFGNTVGAARGLIGSGSALMGGGTAAAGGLYAGANTGAAVGGLYGNAVTGGVASTGIMSSITAGVSAAMPWIAGGLAIDSLIGGGITKAIGGLFGGGRTKTKLNLVTTDRDPSIFEDSQHGAYAQGAFGNVGFDAANTQRLSRAFDESFEKIAEFTQGIADVDNALASIARTPAELNAMAEAVKGVSINAGDAAGIVSQLGRRTTAAVSVVDGEFGQFLRGFGDDVETMIARAQQASGALSLLGDASQRLNLQFDVASSSALVAADRIAQFAGGVDQLAALQNSYYQAFFSDAERAANLQRELTQALGQMGYALPSTRDGFRALVEQQEQLTESGQRNYVQLLQLAGGFDQLQTMLESTGSAVDSFASQLAELNDQISGLENDVRRAYQAFERQAFDQQLALLDLMGDEQAKLALQRERELQSIDPLLHETQRHIWALQDEADAKARATQAANRYIGELSRIRDQLNSSIGSINQWIDQRTATSGSPGMNLEAAGEQFARQLVLAESGDRNALQSITQYADQYLAAGEQMFASGSGFQRIQEDVLDSLKGLPEALSDAEFIVEGFRDVVSNEMAREIERAIFSSQYKIDTLIEFAADASALPQDLRTILGEQAHRLDSTLNYLLGENQLDSELRRLALESTNNLVSTVDYITGFELSESDKLLALSSSNTMSAVIDYIVGSDIDRESRVLALASSNTYSAMIDMILGRDINPDDRRLALGSTNRYASLIDYVVRSELTGGNRRLALSSLNEYDALIDYATRKDVTSADRRLALDNGNRYLSLMDYIVGRDIDDDSKTLALDSNHRYLSTINYILGQQLSSENKRLALDTANRFSASVRYITESEITGGDRRLALSSGQTFDALVQYFSDNRLTKDEQQLALDSANRYVTTMDYIMGRNIDAASKSLALGSTNRYISTVNIVLGSDISSADRRLALNSTNRFESVIRYVVDSPLTGGDRRLALASGQSYEALIGYYVDRDVSRADRELALASGNRYLANIEYFVGRDISSNDRRLALNSNNRYVSLIDQVIGKKITGGDRRLSLNSANSYLTTVDAVMKNGIAADVRTFGLANSNSIMTTIDGVLASRLPSDVRTLALEDSNRFVTTLEAALADGRLTGDERKLLDAKSERVVKTLVTSGGLNLAPEQLAVINAASGTRRLELLADVAFGRTDLDELQNIDDNTKSLEERANDQLKELGSLVKQMTRTAGQFVDLNVSILSLNKTLQSMHDTQEQIAQLQYFSARQDSAAWIKGEMEKSAGKISAARQKLSGAQIDQFNNFIASNRAQGPTNRMDQEDWERIRNNVNNNANLSSAARDYILHTAATQLRKADLSDWERIIASHEHSPDKFFANGGVFTNSIVSNPTMFDMGLMGEAGPEAIMPLSRMAGGELGVRAELPPIPSLPLLGMDDVTQVMRDMQRTIEQQGKTIERLLGESNKHLSAANNQRGAAAKGQIAAVERGNKMLKKLEDDKRLEAAKR